MEKSPHFYGRNISPTKESSSSSANLNYFNSKNIADEEYSSNSDSSTSTFTTSATITNIVRSLNSSDVFPGNDAILRCDYSSSSSLYEVTAWFRDDGKIYLPLEQLFSSVHKKLGSTIGSSSKISDSNGK